MGASKKVLPSRLTEAIQCNSFRISVILLSVPLLNMVLICKLLKICNENYLLDIYFMLGIR